MGVKFSAIDIGSNAIRMIVGETENSRMHLIKKFRAPVRLGRDVFMNGYISDKSMKQAISAFRKFSQINAKYKIAHCRAVATSAVREASNRDAFVKSIRATAKIQIDIIDGVEEARLVHAAIRREIDLNKKRILCIDIGGGSVEITFSEGGMMSATESFPMGTVRILEQLSRRKLGEDKLNIIMGEFVTPLTHYLDSHIGVGSLHFAVGTGGNLECMSRLKLQLLKKTPISYLTVKELVEITDKLKTMSYKERLLKLDMRPDRVDVIVPALMLVQTVMRQARVEKILIPNVGLRDGLLWSTAGLN